jgi:hypothetical protein
MFYLNVQTTELNIPKFFIIVRLFGDNVRLDDTHRGATLIRPKLVLSCGRPAVFQVSLIKRLKRGADVVVR